MAADNMAMQGAMASTAMGLIDILVIFLKSPHGKLQIDFNLRPHVSLEALFCVHHRVIEECVMIRVRHYHWPTFVTHCVMWRYFTVLHDDVIQWKHFPRYWPFVRGIQRSTVDSPYKGQWRAALMFSLICARINGWVNHREAGDLRRHRTHYDVTVMYGNVDAREGNALFYINWFIMNGNLGEDTVFRVLTATTYIQMLIATITDTF